MSASTKTSSRTQVAEVSTVDRTDQLSLREPAARAFAEAERRLFDRYRLDVRSRFLKLADPALRVRVLEAGTGRPALFVHGGGAFAAAWAPLLAGLGSVHGIAVDRPAFGLSDGFDYRGVRLRDHAVRFLASLLDALGFERAPIIANSMGALWSLWFALDRPERVSSLVLLGCPALLLGTTAPFPMRLLSVPGLNRLVFAMEPSSEKQARRLWKRLGHAPDRLPPELVDCLYRAEKLPTYATGWLSLLERALTLGGGRAEARLDAEELALVTQPVLLIWGDGGDPFGGPEVGRRAVGLLPRGQLEIAGEGHLPWLAAPERCAALVEAFLG